MKFKVLAMILALTVVSYAQTATQAAPSNEQAQSKQDDAKSSCACCDKMKSKDGSCCTHDMAAKDGKESMACCSGKQAKACKKMMKGDKDKMAAMCSEGKCCGKEMKDCGAGDDKTMAKACCGGSQCGMGHHEHGEEMK